MPHLQPDLFESPPPVPYSGRCRESRIASASGARSVVKTWTQKQAGYLQLLRQAGALTDHEAAALLKMPLSSINSTRNDVIARAIERGEDAPIVPEGFDLQTWDDGRQTKRVRWALRVTR